MLVVAAGESVPCGAFYPDQFKMMKRWENSQGAAHLTRKEICLDHMHCGPVLRRGLIYVCVMSLSPVTESEELNGTKSGMSMRRFHPSDGR